MHDELVVSLKRQNRLLRLSLVLPALALGATALVAARGPEARPRWAEIDVERINVVSPDGKLEMVVSNRDRLPKPVLHGKVADTDRRMPGLVFYNALGDECGGLIFDGKLDEKGKPASGMHFSMDRFGGDQQLALGHYEGNGRMTSGLNVYDRGLAAEYGPLVEEYRKAPEGPGKEELRKKAEAAGAFQTQRLFVGKTLDRASAVVLADAKGRPRILMLVTADGTPTLQFLDEKGDVVQSLPAAPERKG